MSAIPQEAYYPLKTHSVLTNAVENIDNTILSDEEVYQLKGGDNVFVSKILFGIASGALFIGKEHLRKHYIPVGIFLGANLFAFTAMAGFQKLYLIYTGNNARYNAHRIALYHRYVLNMSEISDNKKKPKYH